MVPVRIKIVFLRKEILASCVFFFSFYRFFKGIQTQRSTLGKSNANEMNEITDGHKIRHFTLVYRHGFTLLCCNLPTNTKFLSFLEVFQERLHREWLRNIELLKFIPRRSERDTVFFEGIDAQLCMSSHQNPRMLYMPTFS